MKNSKVLLLIIFLLSFLIRIYRPGYPPLLWDEASLGYNAYSVLKTGRDEYGSLFPFIFKSFGDYKPGLYVYLCLPFVSIFGLNELSVRLPSILLGSLLPVLLFYFTYNLFKIKPLSYLTALVITFNPYSIHFSRGAWESNILLFELFLSLYFLYKNKYFYSALLLCLTAYTYQSAKLLIPLILPLYIFYFYKNNHILFPKRFFFTFITLLLPLVFRFLTTPDSNRLKVFSIFSYPRPEIEKSLLISESNSSDFLIFHQNFIYFSRAFFERYFNYFSPRFLLYEGDWQNARHSAPYIGVILYPSFFLLLIGLFLSKPNIFHYLLFISPIPAALSRDSISSVRSLPMSVSLCFFISFGIFLLFTKIKHNLTKTLLSIFLFLAFFGSFFYYSDLYYHHLVKKTPQQWLDGYKQAILSLNNTNTKTNIYFTPFYNQPYIYYLFYNQYSPADYQKQANLITTGNDTGTVEKINNISFTTPDYNRLRTETNFMAVFSYDDALRQNIDFHNLTPIQSIASPANFYIYEK